MNDAAAAPGRNEARAELCCIQGCVDMMERPITGFLHARTPRLRACLRQPSLFHSELPSAGTLLH